MAQRVLVVDDDPSVGSALEHALRKHGAEARVVPDAETALAALPRFEADVVLTDVRMPGMDGLELMALLRERAPSVAVVVMTGYDDLPVIAQAMKGGAVDMLIKPIELGHLFRILDQIEQDRRARGGQAPDSADAGADGAVALVGRDPRMVEVFKTVGRLAGNRTTVLIRGESGTGKELVARAIHSASDSASEPFVPVNCTALPANLLESELFGHVKGSFTGATSNRRGCFAMAGEGSIFLDEIGDTSLDFQAKLLRVLQEHEFSPVGSEEREAMRARVIAATHRPLEEGLSAGSFREDLYYRLRVVEIELPALRDRMGDVPVLADHLVRKVGVATGMGDKMLSPAALDVLMAHSWPGNVRELENCLTRAVVMSPGPVIHPENLILRAPDADAAPVLETLEANEGRHVARVLAATRGKKSEAARILAISRPRLDRLIKKFAIEV